VPDFVYEGTLSFFVKIHRQDLDLARTLIHPRVCLLRIPKKRQRKTNGYEGAKGWNHPSHQNGANNGISNTRYGGGSQSTGTGQQMNPIDTEWELDLSQDNIVTTCTLNPLDWYRKKDKGFGESVMPVTETEWKTDGPGALRLRGRKCKYLKWAGLTEQFKFKVRIEATDPNDYDKRIISTVSPETLILFPKLGTFGRAGQVYDPNDPNTHARWFFAFGLKFAP
jgi:hypothetical protein